MPEPYWLSPSGSTRSGPALTIRLAVDAQLLGRVVQMSPAAITVTVSPVGGGGGISANVEFPTGVVTTTAPVFAPVGTVATIWVSEITENAGHFEPPTLTAVAPRNPLPRIET